MRLDVIAKQQPELQDLIASYQGDPDDDFTREELFAKLNLTNSTRGRLDPSGRVIICSISKPNQPQIEPRREEYDETDDNSFSARLTLAAHTAGVVERIRKYAIGCGLTQALVDDIVLAARMHDWGKCDERFQSWLVGKPYTGWVYLGKSAADRTPAERRRLRDRAGYPQGARHEAGSVMAASASGLLSQAHDRDLVLHLIGTHHGWGRPWFPVWENDPAYRIAAEIDGHSFECSDGFELARLDSRWADRFASLNSRYGYWLLAYLEAILRRADCMQSRKESEDAAN